MLKALKFGVDKGVFVQVKGSYKLGKKPDAPKVIMSAVRIDLGREVCLSAILPTTRFTMPKHAANISHHHPLIHACARTPRALSGEEGWEEGRAEEGRQEGQGLQGRLERLHVLRQGTRADRVRWDWLVDGLVIRVHYLVGR